MKKVKLSIFLIHNIVKNKPMKSISESNDNQERMIT